jgi:hypothetical protein
MRRTQVCRRERREAERRDAEFINSLLVMAAVSIEARCSGLIVFTYRYPCGCHVVFCVVGITIYGCGHVEYITVPYVIPI